MDADVGEGGSRASGSVVSEDRRRLIPARGGAVSDSWSLEHASGSMTTRGDVSVLSPSPISLEGDEKVFSSFRSRSQFVFSLPSLVSLSGAPWLLAQSRPLSLLSLSWLTFDCLWKSSRWWMPSSLTFRRAPPAGAAGVCCWVGRIVWGTTRHRRSAGAWPGRA